jgi:hypothetical protein
MSRTSKLAVILIGTCLAVFADDIQVSHSDSPEMKMKGSFVIEYINANGEKERAKSEATSNRPVVGWSDPDWGVYNATLHTHLDHSGTISFRSWDGKHQTAHIHMNTEHKAGVVAVGRHVEFELKDSEGRDMHVPGGDNPVTIDFVGWDNVKHRAKIYVPAGGDDKLQPLFEITQ